MRMIKSLIILGALMLNVGCIHSLHPIYTDEDIVFEPSLVGVWEDGKETWAFSWMEDENAYKLVYTDNEGKPGRFTAHLVNIEGKLFLNFFPEEREVEENAFYQWHFVPFHSFAYVEQIEPTLKMRFPNGDWLEKHLKDNPDAIKHELYDGEMVVLTASTA